MNQIPSISEITARAFCDAFVRSFAAARTSCSDEQWREGWRHSFSRLMLWQTTESYRPPQGLGKSVLATTADELRLHYRNGEPLRLDAVFSRNQKSWFPISVAIEHECDWRGLEAETKKLLSVRASLKVAITYLYGKADTNVRNLTKIKELIDSYYKAISAEIAEDPSAQYLFIAGVEENGAL